MSHLSDPQYVVEANPYYGDEEQSWTVFRVSMGRTWHEVTTYTRYQAAHDVAMALTSGSEYESG
jgi:hypothetical protein